MRQNEKGRERDKQVKILQVNAYKRKISNTVKGKRGSEILDIRQTSKIPTPLLSGTLSVSSVHLLASLNVRISVHRSPNFWLDEHRSTMTTISEHIPQIQTVFSDTDLDRSVYSDYNSRVNTELPRPVSVCLSRFSFIQVLIQPVVVSNI